MKQMCFVEERAVFEKELETYFSAPTLDIGSWERDLHALSSEHPQTSPFLRKVLGYSFMAEHCPVHIFRHCPFYFELNTGRHRTDLGTGGLGGWFKREPFGQSLTASSGLWWGPCGEHGLSRSWLVLDDNHHTVSYEKVLRQGLRGVIAEAEREMIRAGSDKERAFLQAAIAGNQAMIGVAERFAAEADRLLAVETEPPIRRRLQRIAATARRVPAGPADSFYEALCVILFVFHVLQSLEGNGISVFGHVDRLLSPYYDHDIEAGRLTRVEAQELVSFFLAISDARYGLRKPENPWHVGTNGTITLGGCKRDGTPIFNEVTRLMIETHHELGLIDPKLNARISMQHPMEYFDLLADCVVSGSNTLAIFNDDVVISANVKSGKALEDSRQYVGGGCQENVLENCEINSRATMSLNLLNVFLMGFFPERWAFFFDQSGVETGSYTGCVTFKAFLDVFLGNLRTVIGAHVAERNRTEREGLNFNPCPLHSSMLDDCLASHLDMMEGGCRYSAGSLSLTGIGSLVDSLFSVKTSVYDRAMVSLDDLSRMLATDFKGEEVFRNLLAHRIAKFGQEEDTIRAFSAEVFAEVAQTSSGLRNSRGGRYEASLFAFRSFMDFGTKTGATPDGRHAGDPLSSGMSPSLISTGHRTSIGQILGALEPLDLTLYPVVAVLDVMLPAVRGGLSSKAVVPVIRRFLTAGGSVLQINCVDPDMLKDARIHPEQHPDLVMRVSGYSSVFVRLGESIQDEIISRTVAGA